LVTVHAPQPRPRTHAIDRTGSFTARLTVTDSFGRSDTTQQVVKVGSFADHPGLMGYTGWVNYLETNPIVGRHERRILDFLTHDGRHITAGIFTPTVAASIHRSTVRSTELAASSSSWTTARSCLPDGRYTTSPPR
jgi:hypothetical protein